MRSWLQDPDGDGVFTFTTTRIPAGSYEVKAAHGRSWVENYGRDGVPNGVNIAVEVPAGATLTFRYTLATNVLVVETAGGGDGGEPPPPATEPTSVTMAGRFQDELGCPGDWQPECDASQLRYEPVGKVWWRTLRLPAGRVEYKAALNASWDENYGENATRNGANIVLDLPTAGDVTFFYSHATRWVADNVTRSLATLPGDCNSELGCPGDWQPACLATLLQDPDGDGTYHFATDALPSGTYQVKIALNRSWAENYGAGAARDGANIPFTVPEDGAPITFTWDSTTKQLAICGGATGPAPSLRDQRAHWVARDLIDWPLEAVPGREFALHSAAEGGLAIADGTVTGGRTIPLTVDPAGLPAAVTEKFRHLAGMTALRLPAEVLDEVPALLRSQVAVSAADDDLVGATGLQIPGVLDDLYAAAAADTALGVSFTAGRPTLRLWAPTAASVRLQLFVGAELDEPAEVIDMGRDSASGVWSAAGDRSWDRRFYRYEVEVYVPSTGRVERNVVTDPYSVSLATDSTHSQIVDLRDRALQPGGWSQLRKPALADPADISIYELHVRDFSAADATVVEEHRGRFTAFTQRDTDGMRHLRALARYGITHLHLLPTFDIATVPEDPADRREPDIPAAFAPDSPLPQERIAEVADLDAFNWGYDPYHYTVPEGSYATDPQGARRILEYRQMVQTLNRIGLRVVADVVYNHTHAAGQAEKSVLDRVVPGYYHRLDERGQVETSTCCPNTATEHAMMEKLMIDSVLTWATEYKVDGFRFDLMGHHTKANMLRLRAALDALTPARHGVDGAAIHLYGEGWNFGEVADDARFVQATQVNMAGTGIGTFNDRLRDAARGGSPFSGLTEQGFASGLAVQPNGTEQGTAAEQAARARRLADLVRIGLAGNLADYELVDAAGQRVKGSQLGYNGSPAGYAKTPTDNVVYVDKHDNETLFDAIAYKAPRDATTAERVRMQNVALSLPALAQGTPFFQAGSDLLRSKSLDRDSYNSGDHFNRIDWSRQTNNWGVGLPIAEKNEASWPLMGELLRTLPAPAPADIDANAAAFRELLEIRSSSELFRLRTAAQVQRQVRFGNTGPEQVPGLITMHLSGGAPRAGTNAPHTSDLFVVVNAAPEQRTVRDGELPAGAWRLHEVQRESADPVVRSASARGGAFTVPSWTTAVFELPAKGRPRR